MEIIKNLKNTDQQKFKMLKVKAQFLDKGFKLGVKSNGYIDLVLEYLPELNTITGRERIKNVWLLRQTDEKILSTFVIILQNITHE